MASASSTKPDLFLQQDAIAAEKFAGEADGLTRRDRAIGLGERGHFLAALALVYELAQPWQSVIELVTPESIRTN